MNSRSRPLGLIFMLLSPMLVIFGLAGYPAVDAFVDATYEGIATLILRLFGIVGVLLFPLGIYLFVKKDPTQAHKKMDPRSGKGDQSVVPAEIKGWNWGAAGLTWIWGTYYSVWLSFLMWISPVNLVWWIVLGKYGSDWAWRNQEWASVEEFKTTQEKWKVWGILFVVLRVLLYLVLLLLMIAFMGTFLLMMADF